MLESKYQSHVLKRLNEDFPGCFARKVVPPPQGIPDLAIDYGKTWAKLETKKSINEPYRPNQEYYIQHFNKMGFAAMICPENEEHVFSLLRVHFRIYSGLFIE